jgi:hypothetical protein
MTLDDLIHSRVLDGRLAAAFLACASVANSRRTAFFSLGLTDGATLY